MPLNFKKDFMHALYFYETNSTLKLDVEDFSTFFGINLKIFIQR